MTKANTNIESCNDYKYLDITLDKTGTDDEELRTMIVQARKIGCLNNVLWNKDITKKRKFNIYKTLLHRCERASRLERIRNEVIW